MALVNKNAKCDRQLRAKSARVLCHNRDKALKGVIVLNDVKPNPEILVTWDDVCVCCGALVPEGTQICAACRARFLTEE